MAYNFKDFDMQFPDDAACLAFIFKVRFATPTFAAATARSPLIRAASRLSPSLRMPTRGEFLNGKKLWNEAFGKKGAA
jgi:hypothetical protein